MRLSIPTYKKLTQQLYRKKHKNIIRMGLSEETNGHPQVSKFIQKINKAKLMTFLIRVNAASTRIQGAFKKS